MMKSAVSVIKLFKALPIEKKESKKVLKKLLQKVKKRLLRTTIQRGFIFSPEVLSNYSVHDLFNLVKVIENEIGLTPEKMNNTFQKDWEKVRTISMEQLVEEQLLHYFTTYGHEIDGIYNENRVYVPHKKLDIPKLTEDVKIVVIRGYTKEELKEKLIALLDTGIALAEDTRKDVVDVAKFVDVGEADISSIKNREVKIALYDTLGLVPENPVEFLRYLIFKTTGQTLLINNDNTIGIIKQNAVSNTDIVHAINAYKEKHGLERLAEIFLRNRDLFLAFRSNDNMKRIINKISRLTGKYHKPMNPDFLNNITSMISRGECVDQETLELELEKSSVFRKIRVAQALHYRSIDGVSAIMYKIRNRKSYAKEFSVLNIEQIEKVLGIVLDSIIKDIGKNVHGKKIFIPEGIEYALPATEKMFTGNLPSGTCVTINKNMIFGVHWEDVEHQQIDLDLSLIDEDGEKYGWDASYSNVDGTLLYSGDLTYAPKPKGASELFYIEKGDENKYIMFLNSYNHRDDRPVPFKILVANEQTNLSDFHDTKYMVNPNNVQCITKTKVDMEQKVLGLVVTTLDEIRFYFNESYMGKSIVSSNKEYVKHARQYLFDFSTNQISLNDILVKAGAIRVEDREHADIDLSPESLEKDTIISLLC